MAQDWSTTALLASVKRRGMIPSTSEALGQSDYLAIATEELQTYVMDVWLSAAGEYAVNNYDVTIVSGTSSYPVHARSAGEILRQVLILDGSTYRPLVRVEPEHQHQYSTSGSLPGGYYFMDDKVVLLPTPSTSGTLRLQYYRRPNSLVTELAVATIGSINGSRTVITVSGSTPSTLVTGVSADIVAAKPGFRTLLQDTTLTVSGTITVSTALPSSVVAGDKVCLAGEADRPQIPPELHPLLAQRTTMKCLEALGDPKAQFAAQVCEQMRAQALSLLTPRSAGEARYLINRNGPGYPGYRRRVW